MDYHAVTFEQYCCVLQRNIIIEETHFHNGTKRVRCTHHVLCAMNGGCRNPILRARIPVREGGKTS